jgi:hypothetical protein
MGIGLITKMKQHLVTALLGLFLALMWWGCIYFYVLGHEVVVKVVRP